MVGRERVVRIWERVALEGTRPKLSTVVQFCPVFEAFGFAQGLAPVLAPSGGVVGS